MLTNSDIREKLDRYATFIDETDAVRRYLLGPSPIVFRLKSKDPYSGLAVPRRVAEQLSATPIPGVTVGRPLRNSNYIRFEKEANIKGKISPVGIRLEVESEMALDALIDAICSDFYEIELATDALPEKIAPSTDKWTLALARVGQGKFRRELVDFWGGACALTGVSINALLAASHIKPWAVSDDRERLSSDNGLLMTANLHAVFDAGLIGFLADGTLLISEINKLELVNALKLADGTKLRRSPSPIQSEYLSYHKEHVFLRERRKRTRRIFAKDAAN